MDTLLGRGGTVGTENEDSIKPGGSCGVGSGLPESTDRAVIGSGRAAKVMQLRMRGEQ